MRREMDLVEHVIPLPGRELLVLAPRDGEALLSEEAFARDEFLPYWAELWPSAVALARIVARRPLTGRRVLELGCGLGLPALAAAAAGGRVLATDWARESVAMTARNAEHNGFAIDAAVFRWDADPAPLGPPWPLVLASDVLYEARNGDRSEEHTSELQSHSDLVCRLLLEKKKNKKKINIPTKTEEVQKIKIK